MKNKLIRYILLFICLNLLFIKCAPDSESELNSGIKLFKDGHITKGLKLIEKGVLNSITKECYRGVNLSNTGSLLYCSDHDTLKILYPGDIDVNIPVNCNIIYFDQNFNRVVFLDGVEAKLFNINGALIKNVPLISGGEKDKNEIMAIALINDMLLYYKNSRIYYYNLRTSEHEQLVRDKFSPPYRRSYYYEVKFYINKSRLAFIVGAAGAYNMSVIDVDKALILLNNQKIASSKLFFQGEYIYFITGSSGKWALRKISIYNKKKTSLMKFNDLVDIVLASAGIIYEKSDGLWINGYYDDKPTKLPLDFELAGECCSEVLIKNNNDFCLIYMKKLFDKVEYLKQKIPAIYGER